MDEITHKRLLNLSKSWENEARRWTRKAKEFKAEGLLDNAELFRQKARQARRFARELKWNVTKPAPATVADQTLTETSRELQTTRQAGEILGLGMVWTRRLVMSGLLPSIKIGNQRLIERGDVEAFKSRREAERPVRDGRQRLNGDSKS